MKKIKRDLAKEELIKLLQNQEDNFKEYQENQENNLSKAQELEIELLKRQRQVDDKIRTEQELEEQKNINELQRYSSEAIIKKSQIDKAQVQLEAIDRELVNLLDDSKKRISKLANQFIDFNREKTVLLTQNELESRRAVSEDVKSISKYYENSMKRSKNIMDEEYKKEIEAKKNITVLTKTIDLSVLKDDEDGNNPSSLFSSNNKKI